MILISLVLHSVANQVAAKTVSSTPPATTRRIGIVICCVARSPKQGQDGQAPKPCVRPSTAFSTPQYGADRPESPFPELSPETHALLSRVLRQSEHYPAWPNSRWTSTLDTQAMDLRATSKEAGNV